MIMNVTPTQPSPPYPTEPERPRPSKVASYAAAFFEGVSSVALSLKKKVTKETATEIDIEALWVDLLNRTNTYFEPLRVANPFCNEATALKDLQANIVGQTSSKKFSFVASQLPSYYEFIPFWEEMFKGRYSGIVDLTSIRDLPPGMPTYYPEMRERIGGIDVEVRGLLDETTFVYLMKKEGDEKTIIRYHFDKWLDGKSLTTEMLIFLIKTIEEKFHPSKELPLWIHCRAGIGRTGTLITAFILKEKIESEEIRKENLGLFLVELIFALRKERSQFFVETFDQFALLLSFGTHLLEKRL
jgi:protein tyrosine phosphatase